MYTGGHAQNGQKSSKYFFISKNANFVPSPIQK